MKNVFIIFALIFSPFLIANEKDKNKEVTIQVLMEELYPLHYMKNGDIVGSSIELIKKTLDQAGFKYTLQMQPWARVYNTTLYKKNTLLLSIARIKKREPLFAWIGLSTKRNYFLFGLSGIKVDPNMPLEDIEKYRVAIIRQAAIHQYLVSKGLHNQQLISSYRQAIKMLLNKRVDLVSGIGGMFIENCYRLKLDCDQIKPVYQFKEPSSSIFIAMNKSTDKKIITRIKTAYQKVLADNK